MAKKTGEQRRKELIDAAGRAFMEKGYAAATISDITREAGSSHGTFYVYFDGKEEIFDAFVHDYVSQTYDWLVAMVEAPGKTVPEKIKEIVQASREFDSTEWWVKELNQPHLIHLRARLTQRATEKMLPQIVRLIQDGVEEGSIDVPFPEAAALFLITALVAQREHAKDIGSLTDEDWALAYQDLFRRLLGLEM